MNCEEEQPPAPREPLSSTVGTGRAPGQGTTAPGTQPAHGHSSQPTDTGQRRLHSPAAAFQARQPEGACASSPRGPSRRGKQDAVLVINTGLTLNTHCYLPPACNSLICRARHEVSASPVKFPVRGYAIYIFCTTGDRMKRGNLLSVHCSHPSLTLSILSLQTVHI